MSLFFVLGCIIIFNTITICQLVEQVKVPFVNGRYCFSIGHSHSEHKNNQQHNKPIACNNKKIKSKQTK